MGWPLATPPPNRLHSIIDSIAKSESTADSPHCQGSWSLNTHSFIRRGEFYVVAHEVGKCIHDHNNLPFDGGRVLWASPIESIPSVPAQGFLDAAETWINITIPIHPRRSEDYYLYVKSGPPQLMLAPCLQVSNLMAEVVIYDNAHGELSKQYGVLVRHMTKVENRGAFYTKMLQAVTRSIRIQLARKHATEANEHQRSLAIPSSSTIHAATATSLAGKTPSNNIDHWTYAIDPFLETFFEQSKIERDSDTLQILEEIACFLSEHAYISETRVCDDQERSHGGSKGIGDCDECHGEINSSYSGNSAPPDWVPFSSSLSTSSGGSSGGSSISGLMDGIDSIDINRTATDSKPRGVIAEQYLSAMRQQQQQQHQQQHHHHHHQRDQRHWRLSSEPNAAPVRHGTVASTSAVTDGIIDSMNRSRHARRWYDPRTRQFLRKALSRFRRPARSSRRKQARRSSEATEAMLSSQSWTVDQP